MGLRAWLQRAANDASGRFQRWLEKIAGGITSLSGARAQPPATLAGVTGPHQPALGPLGPPGLLAERLSTDNMDEEEARRSAEWHTLASSNVGETRYLAKDRQLEIRFLSNYYYTYDDVPPDIFRNFIFAESPGRYVWNVIRANGYAYHRIGAGVIPSYRMPSGWKPWREGTHGRTQKDKVARVPLPEEVAAHGKVLTPHGLVVPLAESLLGGESAKVPDVKLKLRRWKNNWVMPPKGP